MKSDKILHVMISEKFMSSFIDFVDKNFGREGHHYVFITSEKYEYGLTKEHNVEFLHTDTDIFKTLLSYMQKAKKIILHGLWRDKVDKLLVENPELFKKCYWIMWGGDFYFPKNHSQNRKKVIKNVGFLVTGIEGDYRIVKKSYGAIGKRINVVTSYPSNIYQNTTPIKKIKNIIHIQVGNSATNTNRHLTIFKALKRYRNKNIKIFTPLSYGNKPYRNKIIKVGKSIFGKKFIPMVKFMPLYDYNKFLTKIDIAIFNHNRQQAAGTTYALLGLGAKVYLNAQTTLAQALKQRGIVFFDNTKINLSDIDATTKQNNILKIKDSFSWQSLRYSLSLYLDR